MNTLGQSFEQMNVPTCVIDSEQQIVFWNNLAATTFGKPAEDVLGHPCWQIFNGRSPNGDVICSPNCPLFSQITSNQPAGDFNMVTIGANGQSQQLKVSSQPVLTEDRQAVQLVHFLRPYSPTPPTYHVYLLGSVYLQTADGNLSDNPDWADPYLQATFIYLLLNRNRVVTRLELQRHIWPHLSTVEANRQITAVTEKLCRTLTFDQTTAIHQGKNGYRLNDSANIWVDIDEFGKLLTVAAKATNPQILIGHLQQAVNLYRDDFLINLPFSRKWIESWRTHFRQGYFTALQKLGTLYEQAGDLASAQKTYLSALTTETFSLENNQHLQHLFKPEKSSQTQTLRQCKRLISLLQNELEFLLEEQNHQQPDEAGGG